MARATRATKNKFNKRSKKKIIIYILLNVNSRNFCFLCRKKNNTKTKHTSELTECVWCVCMRRRESASSHSRSRSSCTIRLNRFDQEINEYINTFLHRRFGCCWFFFEVRKCILVMWLHSIDWMKTKKKIATKTKNLNYNNVWCI